MSADAAARRLLAGLTPAELGYARAYSEHIAVGDVEPQRPAEVDPAVANDIRRVLHAAWRERVHTGFRGVSLRGLPRG